MAADIIFMQETIALMAVSGENIQDLIILGVVKEIIKDEVSLKYLVIENKID